MFQADRRTMLASSFKDCGPIHRSCSAILTISVTCKPSESWDTTFPKQVGHRSRLSKSWPHKQTERLSGIKGKGNCDHTRDMVAKG